MGRAFWWTRSGHERTGSLDKNYLEGIRKSIRCWDEKEGPKEALRIKHKNQLSVVNDYNQLSIEHGRYKFFKRCRTNPSLR